jgi:hypothetical protein
MKTISADNEMNNEKIMDQSVTKNNWKIVVDYFSTTFSAIKGGERDYPCKKTIDDMIEILQNEINFHETFIENLKIIRDKVAK